MKLKNILFTSLTVMALTSCNDFLDVESPSSYSEDFVFSQKTEINRALNGVYASILVGDLYGDAYQNTFILNSDVEMQVNTSNMVSHNGYARFDCDAQGGEIDKFWKAAYKAIEDANRFIRGMESSPLYDVNDTEFMQMLGEAKCLRAMVYHDLVVMFGDVPFTFKSASQLGDNYVIPVAKREDIQNQLIEDLKAIAPKMSSSTNTTVERASKEFAWSLIARIALTAGGYSLHPEEGNNASYGVMSRPQDYQKYYRITKEYTDSVINHSAHKLGGSYQDVFLKESNLEPPIVNGDPIFEIPFARESTGNTGYIQGPTSTANSGVTLGKNVWGEAKGNGRLSAFYRFSFDENDKRRDFVNGLWYYGNSSGNLTQDSCLIRSDYTVHNNKWSKLWSTGQFTNMSAKNTGINYPYMRLADVLLMHAEAINELEGPTNEAQESLRKVRARAFDDQSAVTAYIANASSSKAAFLKAVLDERKWEFAGENIRWRDLVRNNLYGQEIIYSFLRYLSVAKANAGATTGFEDDIAEHDGRGYYLDELPESMYYHVLPQDAEWEVERSDVYGYPYPNKTLDILYIYNPYKASSKPATSLAGIKGKTWEEATFYAWSNDSEPTNQCKYSFFGYIRYNESGVIVLVKNGTEVPLGGTIPEISALPPVRYILPYPNAAILRSAGAYKNYYGYN